jgi:hypothetical protein
MFESANSMRHQALLEQPRDHRIHYKGHVWEVQGDLINEIPTPTWVDLDSKVSTEIVMYIFSNSETLYALVLCKASGFEPTNSSLAIVGMEEYRASVEHYR